VERFSEKIMLNQRLKRDRIALQGRARMIA